MSKTYRECQVVAGPFAVWVRTVGSGKGSWRFIDDIAPVFQKFKGQRFSKLVGWLSSKFGSCEVNPMSQIYVANMPQIGTAPSGYGSRQGRLFR